MKFTFRIVISVLMVFILTIPITRLITWSLMVEVKTIQDTITSARASAFEIELTGITQQVLEYNKNLAYYQKFGQCKLLKFHFADGFLELKPVE